jgi:hypothetical protein
LATFCAEFPKWELPCWPGDLCHNRSDMFFIRRYQRIRRWVRRNALRLAGMWMIAVMIALFFRDRFWPDLDPEPRRFVGETLACVLFGLPVVMGWLIGRLRN